MADLSVRFDIPASTLANRASREGWSKRALAGAAVAPDDPQGAGTDESAYTVDPDEVLETALARAGAALAAGRAAEAATIVKGAYEVTRLTLSVLSLRAQITAELEADGRPSPEEQARINEERRAEQEREIMARAVKLAEQMVGEGHVAAIHTRAVFAWRARHLGAATADADRERARWGGWYDQVYDAEGCVRPAEGSCTALPGAKPEAEPTGGEGAPHATTP